MKALSVKQPWASMIAEGCKTIETRTWKTTYRGLLVVVASNTPQVQNLPAGQALCIAELVDCRPMRIEDEAAAQCSFHSRLFSWILEDIRPIERFAVKGKLRLFEVDDELIEPDCLNCNGISTGCDLDGLCFLPHEAMAD